MSFIDERIVKMQFDNKQFESGAKESLETLDRLDKSMRFKDSTSGLDRLKQVADAIDFSPMSNALGSVTGKFSALETVAVGALLRIGSKIEDYGAKLLKSFTIDNVAAGWQKFSDKTGSVATLVSQGNSLETVNKQLEKLNWFTDETSYNFVDMVSNIGKFTATGVELEDAVGAMEGIATWTALSGQDAATASRAMYQLSQAMGAGVMRKEDYKSIQNASMDTQEFRQKAIDAAVALKTLKDNGDGTYTSIVDGAKQSTFAIGQFADNLTEERWFTKDVMMQVFGEYSSAVDELYKAVESGEYSTASEAIEAMGGDLDAFGLKAFKAAQEARSWKDVVDSVKDAVSTGWMTTWELIFGNYEEAKKLWTDLANELYDVFAEGGNARNEMLKEWKELGGREDLLEAFWNTWNGIRNILDMVSESFRDLFPATTAEQLVNFTSKLKDLSETFLRLFQDDRTAKEENAIRKSMELAGYSVEEIDKELNGVEHRVENFKNTFKGLFAIADIAVQAFKALAKAANTLMGYILPAGDGLLGFTGSIGEWLVNLDEYIKENDVFGKAIERLGPIFEVVGEKIRAFAEYARDAFDKIVEFLSPAIDKIKEFFSGRSEEIDETTDSIEQMGEKVSPIAKIFEFFGKVFERIKELFDAAAPIFQNIGASLGKMWDNLHNGLVKSLQNISIDSGGLMELLNGGIFALVGVGLKKFIDKIRDFVPSLDDFKSTLIDMLDGIKSAIDAWKQNQLADVFVKMAIAIGILAASLFVLSTVDHDSLFSAVTAIGALAAILVVLTKVLEGMIKATDEIATDGKEEGGVVGKVKSIIGGVSGSSGTTNLVKIAGSIIAIAGAVLILAFAVKMLSSLTWEDLVRGLTGVIALLAALTTVAYFLSKMGDKIVSGAGGLVLFAVALRVLVSSVKSLSEINGLKRGIGSVLILMAALTAVAYAMSNMDKMIGVGSGIGFVLLAASIKILVSAVDDFGQINESALNKGLGAMFSVMAFLAIFTHAVKTDKIVSTSFAMIVMASSMLIFAKAMGQMGGITDEGLGKAFSSIAIALIAFAVAAATLKNSVGAAASMLVMSIALIAFGAAMKVLSTISWEGIAKSLVVLGASLLILGVAAAFLTPFTNTILLLSAAFVIFGIGLNLISSAVVALSAAILALASAVSASLPILISGLGKLIMAFVEAIRGSVTLIAGAVVEIILAILNALANNMIPIIQAGVMLIANFLYGILSMVPELLRVVGSIIVAVIKGVCQIIREGSWIIVEAVVDLIDAVFDAFIEAVAGILEMIPVVGGDISEQVRKAKDWVVPALEQDTEELANKFVDTYTGTVDGRSGEISDTIKDGITTGGDVIAMNDENGALSADSFLQSYAGADWSGTGIEGIQELTDGMMGELSASEINTEGLVYGNNVPESIKTGISENSGAPAEAVNEMVEKAKTALESFPKDSEEAGRRVPESLKSGIASKASTVKTAATNLKSNIQGPLKNMNMTSIGQAIPEGIAYGMGSRSYLVRNKVQELSDMIPNGLKKLLGINSPSKVVAALMECVPEGAAVGIDSSMYHVYNSISDMSNVITNGLSESISKVSDYVESDLDLTPTITPVMDLSSIQNGTLYANKMLSGLTASIRPTGNIADISTRRSTSEQIQDALNGAMADISNAVYGRLNDNTNYTIEVPVVLDGREVARVTAPYTKNEIARLDRNSSRRGGIL